MPFADDGLPLRLAGEKPNLIQEAEKALNRVRAKISGDVQERAFAEARETLDAMERWFEDALRSNPAQESAAQGRYEVSDSEAESLQNRQAEVLGRRTKRLLRFGLPRCCRGIHRANRSARRSAR